MSDIVERLRNWRTVHLARLHLLMEEAADEIERLSRTGSDGEKTGDDAAECHSNGEKTPERERANHPETPDSSTLTDEEREAINMARKIMVSDPSMNPAQRAEWAITLSRLLERMEVSDD